ncbi:hypothetical protein OESDEN_00743 [Oesophagostomum dentatum]|uniref:Uncharacterized protein n=1 Tax=Oesophagostomum dentatum TaxID=61180 RepID=A0A0B1TPU9_OESDE|nr:hypothetical protein OESDEN_00743 [Oesophagostomum dentatum]
MAEESHLVKHWISFNEIFMHAWCAITNIEGQPQHSPNTVQYSTAKRKIPYIAAHNMMIAHAKAYRMYDREYRDAQKGTFGIVVGGRWCTTSSESPEDNAAARRAMDWCFNWMVNPICGVEGDYPKSMRRDMSILEQKEQQEIMPRFTQDQMDELKGEQLQSSLFV